MKKYAIIVAGGNGNRMNSAIPKQFLMLKGKPVLYYAIQNFLDTFSDCKIILALPEEHVATGQEIIDAFFDYNTIEIVMGGRTRFHSVQNGLALVDDEESVVFVHDAVRPLVSSALIVRCYASVVENGTAIPVVDCKDSVRIVTEDGNEALERTSIKLVQTPQAFHSKILLPAYKIDYKDKFTDDATVVEAFGLKVSLIKGEEDNIKITKPIDFILAEAILNNKITN